MCVHLGLIAVHLHAHYVRIKQPVHNANPAMSYSKPITYASCRTRVRSRCARIVQEVTASSVFQAIPCHRWRMNARNAPKTVKPAVIICNALNVTRSITSLQTWPALLVPPIATNARMPHLAKYACLATQQIYKANAKPVWLVANTARQLILARLALRAISLILLRYASNVYPHADNVQDRAPTVLPVHRIHICIKGSVFHVRISKLTVWLARSHLTLSLASGAKWGITWAPIALVYRALPTARCAMVKSTAHNARFHITWISTRHAVTVHSLTV